jgi:predicted methyltransferase
LTPKPGSRPCLSLLELAHWSLRSALKPGDLAVDATAGNGHDTLLLAELVGPRGMVLAFEPQAAAFEHTKAALQRAGLSQQVRLLNMGHENMAACLPPATAPSAAIFNLGFLPGSAKDIITRPATTLSALKALCPALAPGGIISNHTYSGHRGGLEESQAVLRMAAALPRSLWWVYHYHPFNKRQGQEDLILLERQ